MTTQSVSKSERIKHRNMLNLCGITASRRRRNVDVLRHDYVPGVIATALQWLSVDVRRDDVAVLVAGQQTVAGALSQWVSVLIARDGGVLSQWVPVLIAWDRAVVVDDVPVLVPRLSISRALQQVAVLVAWTAVRAPTTTLLSVRVAGGAIRTTLNTRYRPNVNNTAKGRCQWKTS